MTLVGKYLYSIIAGSVLFIGLISINTIFAKDNPIEAGRWVSELLSIKNEAVSKLNPDLVIVSGSNGLFGFSAERLTKTYKINSVNAAIHAGLGIDYTTFYAKRYFSPNRVIVLPLEYEQYTKSSAGGTFVYQALSHDSEYFNALSTFKKLKFIASIPLEMHFGFIRNLIMPSKSTSGRYDSKTINKYGDETKNNWSYEEKEEQEKRLKNSLKLKAVKIYEHSEEAWNTLEEFVNDASHNGVTIILAHPNRFDQSIDISFNQYFFDELERRANKIGLELLGDPKARFFGVSRIYDTNYHQNSKGQELSTDTLYRQLLEAGALVNNE